MKLSLKTKFYLYILPFLVVFPILLFSLITPYTELKAGFQQFEVDANRAQEAESLADAFDSEQLELFHLVDSAPDGPYDLSANPNYADFEAASSSAASQFTALQTEITSSVSPSDLEVETISDVGTYYGQFQQIAGQAVLLSTEGKKQEALEVLGEEAGGLIDEYLRPSVQQLETIKEDDVKTSLPDLTDTLTRHGVIPIPGLKGNINLVLAHFENSVDTEQVAQLLDQLQSEVFYQVVTENVSQSAAETAADQSHVQEIQSNISSTLSGIAGNSSSAANPQEAALVAQVQTAYQQLSALDEQAVATSTQGNNTGALSLLEGPIDKFAEGTLDPLTAQLTANNKADIDTLIASLGEEINVITYWLYGIGAVVFLIALWSLWKLSRDIIAPIISLRNATVRLATGDFSAQVPENSKDEIGDLARAFNSMAARLRESYANLEGKVRAQTAELSTRVEELEKTKKATINLLEDLNTEKAKIQESQAKDEAILGSIGDGLVVCDTEGNIQLINAAFEHMLGWKSKDISGKPFTMAVPLTNAAGERITEAERLMTRTLTQKTLTSTAPSSASYYERKDGSRFPVVITVTPIFAGDKLLGAVEVFRDATREKEIDKAKTEFVSLASHQLRTPLSAIGWYAELLLGTEAGSLNPQQKEFAAQIAESNSRMVDLVNSLLNVSRIDLGTLASEPVPTDPMALLESVIAELMPQVGMKALDLKKTYDEKLPTTIPLDPKLIRIVMQNLLSNAVKYTPEKGQVSVALAVRGKTLLFEVADTGYGIPEAQQSKIFTKLFRADNAKEKDPDGNGLGLYLVKSIVEQHEGKIWFDSKEGVGTTFHVTFPLSGMKKIEGSRTLS